MRSILAATALLGGGDQGLGGGNGADQVDGGSGTDELRGGAGPDRLINSEFLFGDQGDDYLRAQLPSPDWNHQLDGDDGYDICVGDSNDSYTRCEVIKVRS
jgi:hemolysin type calcium-binding protein